MNHIKLFENYHPGQDVAIRKATTDEVEDFAYNTDSGSEAEYNILTMFDHSDNVIGAFIGDKMVGGLIFSDHPRINDATSIDVLYVNPEYRKQRIGNLFLLYIKDNTTNSLVVTNPYTDEAENYFLRLGFRKDEDIDPSDPNSVVQERDKLSY